MSRPSSRTSSRPAAARKEDARLVAGDGRYTGDWNLPGQLHAAMLRSDRAHAELARIDITRALAHPGVKLVLTGEDARAAGFKSLPNIVSYPGKDGQQIRKPHQPVLALGRVRYVGEPVAMVVADTAATRSEEHTSELQSRRDLVCRLLLEKKKKKKETAKSQKKKKKKKKKKKNTYKLIKKKQHNKR